MVVFNKIGLLLNGKLKGWNIAVQDDTSGETGGYYVFEWSGKEGFDNWYENLDELQINLEGVEVKWTEQAYVPNLPTEEAIRKAEEFRILAKKKGF